MSEHYSSRYNFVQHLARQVGLDALAFWEKAGPQGLQTENKGLQDFVTIADKHAEDTIKRALAAQFPQDGFIGEESGGEIGRDGYWVVDPIDGTANYMRGLRHWGVSIAYVQNGQTQIGVVHDSATDRIYGAMLGHGAQRDGKAICVSKTSDPHKAMGILGASRRAPIDFYLEQIRALYDAGIDHRKMGSAAIGIVRVAEGVADFYCEKHLNSWDALAALLIAQEAGATIIVPPMDTFVAQGGEVFCATPKLAGKLENLLIF